MIGTPRTMSTYSVAAKRSGNSNGERTLRDRAISIPNTMMSGAQMRKIFTSSTNAFSTGWNAVEKVSPSKNDLRTRFQPESLGTCHTINPTSTAVLAAAISVLLRRCARSNNARREGADAMLASAPFVSVTSIDVSWSPQ